MVNKNSPWYKDENEVEEVVVETKNEIHYVFKFNSVSDRDHFLERKERIKLDLDLLIDAQERGMYIGNLMKRDISNVYVASYDPKMDVLEISDEVPVDYFRMYEPKLLGENFIEFSVQEKQENA